MSAFVIAKVMLCVMRLHEVRHPPCFPSGCVSGLADAFTHELVDGRNESRLTRGVIVEPRRGRLVLFTGGGENYHAPLTVERGRRTTFHAWFQCRCEETDPDRRKAVRPYDNYYDLNYGTERDDNMD
jgi:hypothetical protein